MIGDVVAREVVLVEQLTDFHLDELEQLGIVDLVAPCSGTPARTER